jgi:putative phosphoribosyl transferase
MATETIESDRVARVDIRQGGPLEGNLTGPRGAPGIVVFAHGSGSSRFSPRNRFVAEIFRAAGLGTFLFDLLTAEEEALDERTAELRFNIPLLAERLVQVTRWLSGQPEGRGLKTGFFGSSTGGGAALVAAANQPDLATAVVSRGGRVDMAGPALGKLRAPTLLILGERDQPVVRMNQEAAEQMTNAEVKLEIVAGATHLFPEPGALEEVANLASGWFKRHLRGR